MIWITKARSIFRTVLAFRRWGLLNAWMMATQTSRTIREAVAYPYPVDALMELEGDVIDIDAKVVPYGLLPAPKEGV